MRLDPWFYLSGLGLAMTAVLLVYFIRAYRRAQTLSLPEPYEPSTASNRKVGLAPRPAPSEEMSKAAVFLKSVHDDILQFNARLQNLEHVVTEKNSIQEQHINEVIANLSAIMGKIENLEPQIQQDLQPQLQSLTSALESLRSSLDKTAGQPPVSGEAAVIAPPDPLEGDSKGVYPV